MKREKKSPSMKFTDCRIRGDQFPPENDPSLQDVHPGVYYTLCLAISKKKEVRIQYSNERTSFISWRRIRPQGFAYARGKWYLLAYCTWYRDYRTFSLCGIQFAKFTGHSVFSNQYGRTMKRKIMKNRQQNPEAFPEGKASAQLESEAPSCPTRKIRIILSRTQVFLSYLFSMVFKMGGAVPHSGGRKKQFQRVSGKKW